MTGLNEKEDDSEDFGDLHGPSESDIERFNREDSEYLDQRKQDAKSALWKLVVGAVFILLVASMFLNVLLPAFSRNRPVDTGPVRTPATVMQIFDGRTISVEIDGIERTVRYIGVQIPTFGDPYYDLAIEANSLWLMGQEVLLEADVVDSDREGRLLRYVWLGDAMINHYLITAGLSQSDDSGENTRYADLLNDAEATARASGIGIWAQAGQDRSAGVISPVTWPGERSVSMLGPA